MTDMTGQRLRERARQLAAPLTKTTELADCLEVLVFTLGRETYAAPTSQVREVQPLRDVTPLPGTPNYLVGVVNLRGRLLAVMDLRRFFDLEAQALSNLNRILVVEHASVHLGVLADTVLGVRQVTQATLTPELPTLTDIRRDFLTGITPDSVIILDLLKLAVHPRLNVTGNL